jgi:hypothetical protein
MPNTNSWVRNCRKFSPQTTRICFLRQFPAISYQLVVLLLNICIYFIIYCCVISSHFTIIIRRYLSQNGEKTKFQNVCINNSFLLIFIPTWYATLQIPYGYLSRTPVSSVRVPAFRARRNTCLYILPCQKWS